MPLNTLLSLSLYHDSSFYSISDNTTLIISWKFKSQTTGKTTIFGKVTALFDFRGGFVLIPHTVEFYQGQSNRLSDRIQFRLLSSDSIQNIPIDSTVTHKGINGWVFERLSP